jgi:hypothetical protein
VIVPGVAGAAVYLIIGRVLLALDPHELFAFTEIFPPEYVLLNATVIDVEVDDPVAPDGSVHV